MNCPRCENECKCVEQHKFGGAQDEYEKVIWCYICGWWRREYGEFDAHAGQRWQPRPRVRGVLFVGGYICTSCKEKNDRKDMPCHNCGSLTFWPQKVGGLGHALARRSEFKEKERYYREREAEFAERMRIPEQAGAMRNAFLIMAHGRMMEAAYKEYAKHTGSGVVKFNNIVEFVYENVLANNTVIAGLLSDV